MADTKEYNYGLGAIDPESVRNDQADIVHMAFYPFAPTEADMNDLKTELKEDDEFGLTAIADRLEIVELPEELVKQALADMADGEFVTRSDKKE